MLHLEPACSKIRWRAQGRLSAQNVLKDMHQKRCRLVMVHRYRDVFSIGLLLGPLIATARPTYEPWKTSSPGSLQQWTASLPASNAAKWRSFDCILQRWLPYQACYKDRDDDDGTTDYTVPQRREGNCLCNLRGVSWCVSRSLLDIEYIDPL